MFAVSDIADPRDVRWLGAFDGGGADSLFVLGDLLYAANGRGGVSVFRRTGASGAPATPVPTAISLERAYLPLAFARARIRLERIYLNLTISDR